MAFFGISVRILWASVWMLVIGCVFSLQSTNFAYAQQSATCRSLQTQLASIETGRGTRNTQKYKRYDRAVQKQQVQIKKTERAARKNGCGLLRSNICKRINSSLVKMKANLSKLRTTRDRAGGGGSGGIGRSDILRAMKKNRCYNNTTQTASLERPTDRRRTLLEQIFGTKTYSNEGSAEISNPEYGRNFGTYRTLCVRSCDGYYFPISFSTTQKHFDNDAQQCQQMCPGTETSLFYHPMPSGDPEASISYRTGEPYESLPNAFAYRKGVNNECSCRFASRPQGFEEIAGQTESDETETAINEIVIGTPVFRKDRAMDPDSFQNMEGGLTLERLASISKNVGDIEMSSKEIRIVGPAFFPVQ